MPKAAEKAGIDKTNQIGFLAESRVIPIKNHLIIDFKYEIII